MSIFVINHKLVSARIRFGALAPELEQRLDIVGGRELAPTPGSGQRVLPLPAATSSTVWPARNSMASAKRSPTICKIVPITA
jgi:hypothetical protein